MPLRYHDRYGLRLGKVSGSLFHVTSCKVNNFYVTTFPHKHFTEVSFFLGQGSMFLNTVKPCSFFCFWAEMVRYKTVDFYVHWHTQCKLEARSGCVFRNPLWTACRLESQWEGCGTQSPGPPRSTGPVFDNSTGKKHERTIKKLKNRQTNL